MQFVTITPSLDPTLPAKYEVTEEARAYLSQLHEPIRIVSVVGSYREGKSYLLGRLVDDAKMFTTSSTSNAQTRGLCISTKFIPNTNILCMDTEGLGAPGFTATLDTYIFAMALSFSSKVIFNTKGAIKTDSVNSLRLAINAAEWLSKQSVNSTTGKVISSSKPDLLWLLRDFDLRLVDDDENPITAVQYLEQSLHKIEASVKEKERNSLINALETLFNSRSCIPMPYPVQSQRDLSSMSNCVPAFENAINATKDAIKSTTAKTIGKCDMTGPVLLAMADSMCVTLSTGEAPQIQEVYDTAYKTANIETRHRVVRAFGENLQSHFTPVPKCLFWSVEAVRANMLEALQMWNQKSADARFEETCMVVADCFDDVCRMSTSKKDQWITNVTNASPDILHLIPDMLREAINPILLRCQSLECDIETHKSKYEDMSQILDDLKACQHPSLEAALANEEELRLTKQGLEIAQDELRSLLVMYDEFKLHTQQIQSDMQITQQKAEQAQKETLLMQKQLETLIQEKESKYAECNSLTQSLKDRAREASENTRKRSKVESDNESLRIQVAHLQQQKALSDNTVKTTLNEIAKLRTENLKFQCLSSFSRSRPS